MLLTALVLGAACSSDDEPEAEPEAPPAEAPAYEAVVEALTDEAMQGRDNQTAGSVLAQDHLIDLLDDFAEPVTAGATGPMAFRRDFPEGTNVLGLIPGGDRADEYVILGAHYDHLGTDCGGEAGSFCPGAADNAAGVAAVLEVGRALAGGDEPPSRSVILAFWDAEEDGLFGSQAYVSDPEVPLADTVAYLNWDIQGANLSPSTTDLTVMVGAETGGPDLVAAAEKATETSDLRTLSLSLLFGQGRSDHASFAAAGVPTVFFTDANSACYHTPQDAVAVVDFDKLEQQIRMGEALARDLVATDAVPSFVSDAPAATYADAVSMRDVLSQAQQDLDLFPGYRAEGEQFLADLETMVEAGPEAFDDAAVGTLLGGSVALVEALTTGECDGYLE
jgi:hypothetical protein